MSSTPTVQGPTVDECFAALQQAKAAHAKAGAAAEVAQAAFFETGAAADEHALEAARAAERSANNHVARAQHLLGNAEARRKAEETAALEGKLAELERQLEDDERESERLIDAEVAAFLHVIEIREARLAHNQAIASRRAKVGSIAHALGRPYASFEFSMTEIEPSHYHVGARLRPLAQGLPGQSPRARWLYELAEGTPNYHPLDPLNPRRLVTNKGSAP